MADGHDRPGLASACPEHNHRSCTAYWSFAYARAIDLGWGHAMRRAYTHVIKKLNYVGIPTGDQARALAFWTDVMGFTITTDRPVGERRWVELKIPGAQTGLLLFTPEGQEDRIGTFFNGSFGCENVQYEYERLSAKGVKFLGPPELKPFPHVYFQDPDGNTFFLSSR